MAFLSKFYGKQVNKAAQLAAHKGIGSLLSFDSSADFPTPSQLCSNKVLCGILGDEEDTNAIQEYFDYYDTSTRNLYVDCESNIVYRWKHFTLDEWKQKYWEQDEDEHYIEPVIPLRVDYDSDEEYEEALADYEASLYPVCDAVSTLVEGSKTTTTNIHLEGWTYVPCAGGGGGDLYWEQF